MSKLKNITSSKGITSEEFFNINFQPPETCPIIDYVISDINYAINELINLNYSNNLDVGSEVKYWVKCYLIDLEVELECIRENVEMIRSWGQQWKDLAKEEFELLTDNQIEELNIKLVGGRV